MSNLGWKRGMRYKSRFKVGDRVTMCADPDRGAGCVMEVIEPPMSRSSRNSASVKVKWDNSKELSRLPDLFVEKEGGTDDPSSC